MANDGFVDYSGYVGGGIWLDDLVYSHRPEVHSVAGSLARKRFVATASVAIGNKMSQDVQVAHMDL